jgi:uncharacterized RmlC-like cupin family protein
MTPNPPGIVTVDDVRVRYDTDDGGFKVGTAIDADSHGSPVVLGAVWIRPQSEAVTWTADRQTHEGYCVCAGTIRVRWTAHGDGEAVVGPGEYFYFPPGGTYTVTNAGEEEAFLIWTVTPSPLGQLAPGVRHGA